MKISYYFQQNALQFKNKYIHLKRGGGGGCVQIVHPKTTTFLKFKTVGKYSVYVFDLNPRLFPKELLD